MKKKRIEKLFWDDFPKLMRFNLFLVALIICLGAFAQSNSTLITIKKNQIGIEEAFAVIKSQAKVYVMYQSKIIDKTARLDLNLEKVSLDKALDAICSRAGLRYEIKDKYVLITKAASNKARKKSSTIIGIVTDESGEPLPGATVMIVGRQVGAISNEEGRYSITANSGEMLRFSYIGMNNVEKRIDNEEIINVTFESQSHLLQEVEVVSNGYQNLPKDRITGSFSTVSSSELRKVATPNIIQRLEGKVPGMKVTLYAGDKTFDYNNTLKSAYSSTRTMGASDYDMNIRGVSTISGEQFPLIVVDGVITEMDLSNFNPEDIDNITVLKDAAAASIWGVRAANGVIVITTKKGNKASKPSISFSASWMTQGKPDLGYLKGLSSAQMLDYEKELVNSNYLYPVDPNSYYNARYYFPEGSRLAMQLKAGSITQTQYDARAAELSAIDNRSQIMDYFYQRASSQQYNLSVSGGGANSSYYYSASYSKEDPYTKKNSGERLTLNLTNTWKLFNWATLTTNFKGSFFTYYDNGTTLSSLYPRGRILMPYEQLADKNGNSISYDRFDPGWTSTLSSAFKDWKYNYLQEQNLRNNKQNSDNYIGNITLNVPIYDGLSSNSTFALEKSYVKSTIYYDPNSFYIRDMLNYYTYPTAATNSLGITQGGALNKNNSTENNYTFREQLNYDKVFKGIHRISALAGIEFRETNMGAGSYTLFGYNPQTGLTDTQLNYSYNPSYSYVAGYSEDDYTTFNGGGYPGQADKRRRFLSYYANASYTLMDKYYISASVRYDDYNNFGVSRKYRATPLYSFGSKWNISRENFMKSVTWVNNLALRLTYGINGNLSLSSSPFTKISIDTNFTTNEPSASIIGVANPQLKWEKTYTTNVGLDFTFFDERLSGSIDYYSKRGRDLLYDFPFSASMLGDIGQTLTRNAAAIDSHGIDANFNVVAYRDKNWDANVGFQFSYNTNKVKANPFFKESDYTSYYSYYPNGIGLLEGYSTDKLFVYRNAGLDQNGLTQIYDENGEIIKSTKTDLTSLKILKNAGHQTPPYFGGLNFSVRYKQFSLNSYATYQFGSVFLKPTLNNYITSMSRNAYFDMSGDIAQRWRKAGDEATTYVPKISSSMYSLNRYKYSDINVLKGDYIRLKQISLSYDLDKALLSKLHVASAQLTFAVYNLGILWKANKEGFDPDYAAGYNSRNLPPEKSYMFSLNVNF
jgi:TonB-linked outer membrane protein, SusC/RagA family